MTVQFKLTGSVGKMGANKPADVKIIQACLGGIKVKARPLYKGKSDGKAGKDLIDAICAFQGAEKIRPSGKIMPGDQTTSKLKIRTPSSVQMPREASMSNAAVAARVKSAVALVGKEIRSEAPLPLEEAKALEKIITAASKQGIALALHSFEVTDQGRFKVELKETSVAGLAMDQSTRGRRETASIVTKIVQQNSRWIGGSSSNLVFTTPVLVTPKKDEERP